MAHNIFHTGFDFIKDKTTDLVDNVKDFGTDLYVDYKVDQYVDSFTDEFNGLKFKYPLTNPPYGGDKNSKTEAQNKRDKVKEYIKNQLPTITDEGLRIRRQKQLKKIEAQEKQEKKEQDKTKVCVPSCSARIQKFAKDNNLKGNDKESCSLMLLMDILEIDGTAVGVLKEGVFFDKKYQDLRKCLVENFNVREVISVPKDQFENTSTKTSIVIFDNTEEKTTEVKFSNLEVEIFQEDKFAEVFGDIVIIENKGDIKGVSDVLVSQATREELLSNHKCSLDGKDYKIQTIITNENYTLNDLNKICDIKLGTRITKKYNTEGNIPVYGGGDITFYTNKPNREKNTLIISRYALSKCCVRLLHNEFYLNDSGLSIHCKNSELQQYVNYILLSDKIQEYIYSNCTSGSIQRNINMNLFNNLQIPIPKSQSKIQEWVDKISAPYNEKNEKQKRFQELETFIQNRIRDIGENEEYDEVDLGSVCEINPENLKNNQFSQINYIDIGSVKEEKINAIQHFTENFPSRAKRIIKKNDILFSTVRPNLKGYTYINNNIENGVASSGFVVIRCNRINPKYIYTLLKDDSITDYLMKNSTGTKYPAVNPVVFEKIKVKIPINKQLIQDLEQTFNQIETLQTEVKLAEELYKKYIKDLSEEAIPNK